MTVYDRSVREAACGLFDRGAGYKSAARRLGVPPKAVRKWQQTLVSRWKGRSAGHGQDEEVVRPRDQGRRGARGGRRRDGEGGGDGALRRRQLEPARRLVPPLPRGRRGGAPAQAEGQAEGLGREGRAGDPRAGARARGPQARGAGGVPKKIDSPEGGARLAARDRAAAVSRAFRAQAPGRPAGGGVAAQVDLLLRAVAPQGAHQGRTPAPGSPKFVGAPRRVSRPGQ